MRLAGTRHILSRDALVASFLFPLISVFLSLLLFLLLLLFQSLLLLGQTLVLSQEDVEMFGSAGDSSALG